MDKLIEKIVRDLFSLSLAVSFLEEGILDVSQLEPPPVVVREPIPAAHPAPAPQQRWNGGSGGSFSRRGGAIKDPPEEISIDFSQLQFKKDALLLKGRKITDAPTPLKDVNASSGTVVVWGDIFASEAKVTRAGDKVILTYSFSDYTSSNTMKIIDSVDNQDKYGILKPGATILVRGDVVDDKYDREISIKPYDIMTVSRIPRMDKAEGDKRVELHCHTKMSAMDGVSEASDLIKTAFKWGHKAIAITDHGVVQAYPDAMNTVDAIR